MAATPCYGAPPAGANLEMFCCNEDETPDLLHTIHHQHIHPAHPLLTTDYYIIGLQQVLSAIFCPCFSIQRAEHFIFSLHQHLYISHYAQIFFYCVLET